MTAYLLVRAEVEKESERVSINGIRMSIYLVL